MENTELKVAEEAAWMARGEWAHVYVWQSPFAVHLELSQHCLSAMHGWAVACPWVGKNTVVS